MKKAETILKEYASRLSEDNLRYLSYRLEQRIGADLAEALTLLSDAPEVDKYLKSAESYSEMYDMIDLIQLFVKKELQKKEIK